MGVSNFLERNPFSALEFWPTVVLEGKEVGAWYNYTTKSSAIALTKAQDEYGQELVWGRISKVSAVAHTPAVAIQRTLVHEFGHHIHRILDTVNPDQYIQTHLIPRSNSVSQYGMFNPREYFAETFSAHTFHRTELLVYDQFGYGMMERVLRSLDLEVAEL